MVQLWLTMLSLFKQGFQVGKPILESLLARFFCCFTSLPYFSNNAWGLFYKAHFLARTGQLNASVLNDFSCSIMNRDLYHKRIVLIKYAWKCYGAEAAINWVNKLEKQPPVAGSLQIKSKYYALVASLNLKLNYIQQAQLYYDKAIKLEPASVVKFLALSAFFQTKSSCQHATYSKIHNYIKQTQGEAPWQGCSKVTVIGNAPNLLGAGQGSQIDVSEFTIRFNYYNTAEKYRPDTGTKTDLWVITPSFPMTEAELKQRSVNKVLITGFEHAYFDTQVWQMFKILEENNVKLYFLPDEYYLQLVELLGAPPSAGICILYYLYHSLGVLDPKQVLGFEFGTQHYYKTWRLNLSRHNWGKEKALFLNMLNRAEL